MSHQAHVDSMGQDIAALQIGHVPVETAFSSLQVKRE